MLRDPLYRAIEEGLNTRLDPELFERCAADLLQSAYPGLTPIRGGGDAGMDGAIPAEDAPPTPLVCTTAADVIGNLTRSLKSYISEGGKSRSVVLATSQALTPRRRRNLENRARELGFTLLNIHAQDDFVGRLYRAPQWRKELLGLTGEPPALSTFPRSRRPLASLPLLGREKDVEWLRGQQVDCLLVGQPGSGKTAVLSALSLVGEGVFLVSDDRAQIADAIRAQVPSRIFVDDAHRRYDLLVELRALREEIGADFIVVATCWPGDRHELQRSLSLAPDAVRELPLLPRKVMADIVRAAGIHGPDFLIGEILDQARGLPGLAVTLSLLCLKQGAWDLASGAFLFRDIVGNLSELVGPRVVPVLAGLAVGGSVGMPLPEVARVFGLSVADVWELITRIEAGGVVRQTPAGTLAVEPAALRDALVREVFFSGGRGLPIRELLEAAPSRASAVHVLTRAKARGAEDIPHSLIREQLEQCGHDGTWTSSEAHNAWIAYAYSGEEAVDWILDRHPELLTVIAPAGLRVAPERVIPELLDAAVGDTRKLPPNPDHPLRLLQDWVQAGRPGTGDAVRRRHLVLSALRSWTQGRSSPDGNVVAQGLSMVLSPRYEISPADPIAYDRIMIQMGHLTAQEFRELLSVWPDALELLRRIGIDHIHHLDSIVREWAFPGMLHGDPSESVREVARSGAARMLQDLAELGQSHPGVTAWAIRLADQAGLSIVHPDTDPLFEVLFPPREYDGDWEARSRKHHAAADDLANGWSLESPEEVAARLVHYDAEGTKHGHTWPRLTPIVAEGIAARINDPMVWIDALVRGSATPDLVSPFLWKVFDGDSHGEAVWTRLFDIQQYRWLCLRVALCAKEVSSEMLRRTLENLEGAEMLVETACLRREVPYDRVTLLLKHDSPAVAAAAAKGVWYSGEKGDSIPQELRPAWEEAVVRHVRAEYILREVFAKDPRLAEAWILARVGNDWRRNWDERGAFKLAAKALDRDARQRFVGELPPGYGPSGFYKWLVGGDPELFQRLLARDDLRSVHLEPLHGRPTGQWIALARVALDSGYSPEDLAEAPHERGWSWVGKESMMWQGWADAFGALESHEDARIRQVGQIGRERAEERMQAAQKRERAEEVFGLS